MESLPQEIKALKSIKGKLDILMSDRSTPLEIRSNDLYECIIRDEQLRNLFPDKITFNRFLRKQHDGGILKQIIPNCRVDTSIYHSYQWYFFRDANKNVEKGNGIKTSNSKLGYYKHNLKILFDGMKFRSEQEKKIYQQLTKCDYLTIEYEYPITVYSETKYVDFKIHNRANQKLYYWEHFGMTNSPGYLDSMTEKIEWYRKNGFRTVEDGGNLIFTIYSDAKMFQRDIDKYLHVVGNVNK